MLAECQRRMPVPNQVVAVHLLHWVAFSFQPLTLDEVVSLIRYLSGDDDFSLEEIPEVVSRFLDIGVPVEFDQSTTVGTAKSIEDVKNATEAEEPESFGDGELVVAFKERSMRAYFRESTKSDTTWRWRPSEAHRRLLLTCIGLLEPGVADKIGPELRKYMRWLFSHFMSVRVEEHSAAELGEVMQAFAHLLSDGYVYSQTLKEAGIVYKKVNTTSVTEHVKEFGRLLDTPEIAAALSEAAAAWWCQVTADPREIRLGIAKGYLKQLHVSEKPDEALAAYKVLHGALYAVRRRPDGGASLTRIEQP